jgi:hypothetical protein
MSDREETAEEQRARYEREWNELCRRMRQEARKLHRLARHATFETRLRACQARLRIYQNALEYLVEAPEVAAYEGPERARDALIEGMEAAAKVPRRQSPPQCDASRTASQCALQRHQGRPTRGCVAAVPHLRSPAVRPPDVRLRASGGDRRWSSRPVHERRTLAKSYSRFNCCASRGAGTVTPRGSSTATWLCRPWPDRSPRRRERAAAGLRGFRSLPECR